MTEISHIGIYTYRHHTWKCEVTPYNTIPTYIYIHHTEVYTYSKKHPFVTCWWWVRVCVCVCVHGMTHIHTPYRSMYIYMYIHIYVYTYRHYAYISFTTQTHDTSWKYHTEVLIHIHNTHTSIISFPSILMSKYVYIHSTAVYMQHTYIHHTKVYIHVDIIDTYNSLYKHMISDTYIIPKYTCVW